MRRRSRAAFVRDLNTADFDRPLVFGPVGNDQISANGILKPFEFDGDAEPETLFGGNGNDTLDGGAGNDHVFGQASEDRLLGSWRPRLTARRAGTNQWQDNPRCRTNNGEAPNTYYGSQ